MFWEVYAATADGTKGEYLLGIYGGRPKETSAPGSYIVEAYIGQARISGAAHR